MRTYEIYVTGSKRPVWKYKTHRGFYKRLRALAALRSLVSVTVFVSGLNNWYQVHLNPEENCLWSSVQIPERGK